MCANYKPTSPAEMEDVFGALRAEFDYKPETWPGYDAPILLASGNHRDELVPARAMFGLVPHWAKDTKISRQTYNARSETIAEKPSYRHAWKERQFCLVPVQHFYEPNYECGKPVRWAIERADGRPFALAAIWETKRLDGEELRSFSLVTTNATDHALMRRFHAPEDEKRSVVVVDPTKYQDWLRAPDDSSARALLKSFDAGAFTARADPRPPAARKQMNTK